MGMDSQYDSHSDTVAKVLPAVQHSVDILSVRQTHTHTFWIISVARALAIIVLLIGGFVFTASNLNGVYQAALSRLSDMGGGTAACFMLAGLALYLQCLETGKLQRIGVRICATLLLLLSGASLWLPLGSNPFPPFDILISSAHSACSIAF